MAHFTWDYEDGGYYHVYPVSAAGEALTDGVTLDLALSPAHDRLVAELVACLERLAASQAG